MSNSDDLDKLSYIAENLPIGSENCVGTKSQMLLTAAILRIFTDRENGLRANEIRKIIGLRTGKTPTEAKVLDDIHTLTESKLIEMDVDIPSRGRNTGFRCTRTFLSSEQARLAINMVRTCKFVTREQRNEICERLYGMVSEPQQDWIAGSVIVDERDLPASPDVFAAAEVFSKAINEKKKVAFRYAARGLDGDEHYSADGAVFEETPIALIFSYGSYYAETWSDKIEEKMTRRLDRIRDAHVSDLEATTSPRITRYRTSVQERISQTFDMYGEGETRDLFLKVNDHAARYVYDRFGHSKKFVHIAGDTDHGYVHIQIKPSLTFYRWLFGMGDSITLTKPQWIMWAQQFWPYGLNPSKSHEDLVADYEFALQGMRDLMETAATAYGWTVEDNEMQP